MALTTAEIEARIIRLRELVNMGLMEIEAAQYYADRLRRRLTLKERYSI